jgi:hypothetical protein
MRKPLLHVVRPIKSNLPQPPERLKAMARNLFNLSLFNDSYTKEKAEQIVEAAYIDGYMDAMAEKEKQGDKCNGK